MFCQMSENDDAIIFLVCDRNLPPESYQKMTKTLSLNKLINWDISFVFVIKENRKLGVNTKTCNKEQSSLQYPNIIHQIQHLS